MCKVYLKTLRQGRIIEEIGVLIFIWHYLLTGELRF